PGSYSMHAPADMFAAIGKNGQIVSISRSTGLVVVRMGDAPENLGEVPFALCDSIWSNLNKAMCKTTGLETVYLATPQITIYPNPAYDKLSIQTSGNQSLTTTICTLLGENILSGKENIDISTLNTGMYIIHIQIGTQTFTQKFIKN
ncbi:MAG: T9SS type A sorting domain-containing protein, partial [Bacteroidota bacterium]